MLKFSAVAALMVAAFSGQANAALFLDIEGQFNAVWFTGGVYSDLEPYVGSTPSFKLTAVFDDDQPTAYRTSISATYQLGSYSAPAVVYIEVPPATTYGPAPHFYYTLVANTSPDLDGLSARIRYSAYYSNGNLLSGSAGISGGVPISYGGIVFRDLTFTKLDISPELLAFGPNVPEPATWAMMIAGMGVVGASMRRRKLAVSFA